MGGGSQLFSVKRDTQKATPVAFLKGKRRALW